MARQLSYQQAINEALRQEMERDPTVLVMGEDNAGGEGAPGERDAWGGVLGGPLLLLLSVIIPGLIGPAVVTAGILAFVAGFLTLVLRSPHEPEDGWDDGSAV